MAFAEVNGLKMFYTDEGSGDPVLFVHGWTCDSLDWSWQLGDFADRHRVIAVDLRSHGRTSIGGSDGAHTAQRYAADLAELLTLLETGPVIAVGHSLGGVVVAALAVEHPSLVRALVEVDPGYGIDGALMGLVEDLRERLSGPEAHEALTAAWVPMEGEISPALAILHRRRAFGMPTELLVEQFNDQFFAADQISVRPAADEYLIRRACPVLSVWADAERGRWEETILQHPYSSTVLRPGAGHWLHQARPEQFNKLVLDWIDGLPADAQIVTSTGESVGR